MSEVHVKCQQKFPGGSQNAYSGSAAAGFPKKHLEISDIRALENSEGRDTRLRPTDE